MKENKMAQTILAFGLYKEKLMAVRQTAQKNSIQVKEINRKDYNQKLGALTGIQGFSKEKGIYTGPEFPLDHLLWNGFKTGGYLSDRLQNDRGAVRSLKGNPYST